jgi:predicted 3-demethylubiquinone-9 3-methyltransferase (glyoxalase superfamily)
VRKITPCLWFDGRVDEAIEFYQSIFEDFRVSSVQRYGEGAPLPAGTILTATIVIVGQDLLILNGGPHYQLSEAFSLYVPCESQEEVDYFWDKLSAEGGEPGRCGWLKDKFGVSWQIVPTVLGGLLGDQDPAKAQRVLHAMLQMNKLIIADLEQARDQ